MGFVLSQEFENGEHPIAYGSKTFKGAEVNYPNTDREMCAIFKGAKHHRPYIYGHHIKIRTDHQPIMAIDRSKPVSKRVCNWVKQMQEYDYEIEYVPATKLKHADALSRIKIQESPDPESQVIMFEHEPR